jgi:hypothetical protein
LAASRTRWLALGCAGALAAAGHHGHYQVLSLHIGPGHYDPAWVDANFSAGAAAEINSPSPPGAPDPVGQAWRAFGA